MWAAYQQQISMTFNTSIAILISFSSSICCMNPSCILFHRKLKIGKLSCKRNTVKSYFKYKGFTKNIIIEYMETHCWCFTFSWNPHICHQRQQSCLKSGFRTKSRILCMYVYWKKFSSETSWKTFLQAINSDNL